MPLVCGAFFKHGKLIFCQHMMNHGLWKYETNIIFNTKIRCAVYQHEFKHKDMSELCTIFPLFFCKNWQNLVRCMQLQQQCGVCLQSHIKRRTFSKNMFVAWVLVVQHMYCAYLCTGFYTLYYITQSFLPLRNFVVNSTSYTLLLCDCVMLWCYITCMYPLLQFVVIKKRIENFLSYLRNFTTK